MPAPLRGRGAVGGVQGDSRHRATRTGTSVQAAEAITALGSPVPGRVWAGRPTGFSVFKHTWLQGHLDPFSFQPDTISAKISNLNGFPGRVSAPGVTGDITYRTLITGASTFDGCPVWESFSSETTDAQGLSSSHFTSFRSCPENIFLKAESVNW